jgi:hypothetical protein
MTAGVPVEVQQRLRQAKEENGFALAVTLLALLALTAISTAGFLLSHTDLRVSQNHRSSVDAFYMADAGLANYLARGNVSTDTQVYHFPSGSTYVWGEPLVDVNDASALWRVLSRSAYTRLDGLGASRMLSRTVLEAPAPFNLYAAVIAPGGLNKNGAAGLVSGFDAATPADCSIGGTQNVAGLVVPPGGLSARGLLNARSPSSPPGAPPTRGFAGNPGVDSSQVAMAMLQATKIPWQSLITGNYVGFDYVVSQTGYPSFRTQVPQGDWPVILVDQPGYRMNPTMSGRGTLIVLNDLALSGNLQWDGIILVGDDVTSNGRQTVRGAVVAGLNLMLNQSTVKPVQANGNWDFQYHSCNIRLALGGLGPVVEEPGTWSEVM